ncbi:mitochondrial carrier [Basidiobolus meristosporus CBS 931.73]|uniref:Mitochondrial carrier n=1 Tax=Basidiobolus meristosporus CBS 931.73 TaxID=1314790 RepID=A0A1Y1VRL4_9FUNG|nr:mitochondrial carrier [Basidiobolus meristosporus CBS 931.73]|eukprot:ORX63931.1 mitochondrial carrier [Basidiobolus meristosporus CBS 931.73]
MDQSNSCEVPTTLLTDECCWWCFLPGIFGAAAGVVAIQPFAVGATLLQIQYLPKENEVGGVGVKGSDVGEAKTPGNHPIKSSFQLPPLYTGPLGILKALIQQETEGWQSLWKGQLTTLLFSTSCCYLNWSLDRKLNAAFGLDQDAVGDCQSLGGMAIGVTTSFIVGALLSPIEIAQTRLVAQASNKKHRKYRGLVHLLRTVVAEEGLGSLFWSPSTLPTAIYYAGFSFLRQVSDFVRKRVLHIDPNESPILDGWVTLGFSILQTVLTFPLDTICKRLRCQIPGRRFDTVVQTRQVPYAGVIDCWKSILTEESALHPQERTKCKNIKGALAWNWRGLYSGAGVNITCDAISVALNIMMSVIVR